jgi:hypothetical protein
MKKDIQYIKFLLLKKELKEVNKNLKIEYGQGVKIIKMLNRTNILFIVERNNLNQVIIYDDYKSKEIKKLKFNSEVKIIKVRKDK